MQLQFALLHALQYLPEHKHGLLLCLAMHHDVIGIAFKWLLGMVLRHPVVEYHMQEDVGQ